MLFILDKEKICTYVVSFLTVVVLFCVTKAFQEEPENTVPTSTNTYSNNTNNSINY